LRCKLQILSHLSSRRNANAIQWKHDEKLAANFSKLNFPFKRFHSNQECMVIFACSDFALRMHEIEMMWNYIRVVKEKAL